MLGAVLVLPSFVGVTVAAQTNARSSAWEAGTWVSSPSRARRAPIATILPPTSPDDGQHTTTTTTTVTTMTEVTTAAVAATVAASPWSPSTPRYIEDDDDQHGNGTSAGADRGNHTRAACVTGRTTTDTAATTNMHGDDRRGRREPRVQGLLPVAEGGHAS
ncbi:hypothetical protein GUJ93_ZPchr0013g34816 [Zizania palustris]|uniref:Secreted protein n=1 Tax=Zizania palustris TaxID=103762 RepID=A0A8J5WXU4_ZIZPA|nr:hypothetical protein GUJ93_ZPchr0013g34816 [Zizania palustris]